MDAPELNTAAFWSGTRPVVLAPPRLRGLADELESRLSSQQWAEGGVVFASSGSAGSPKWVFLRKAALLASARAVNAHLRVGKADRWLLALPLWHVGGFGVVARAFAAGGGLVAGPESWDPVEFARRVEREEITCTSLVPTQVHDLVAAGLRGPDGLRVIVVGGGALAGKTGQQARELGWPVLQSYGMTETASQVATGVLDDLEGDFSGNGLTVLPGWEVETDSQGRLCVRGEALFDGYLDLEDGEASLQDPRADGWFTTTDRVTLDGERLTFEGRVDRVVKVLGELVDVAALQNSLAEAVGERGTVVLVALEDERAGARIVPVVAGEGINWGALVGDFNRHRPGFARLTSPVVVSSLPRTALGKPDMQSLRALAEEKCPSGLPSDGNSN